MRQRQISVYLVLLAALGLESSCATPAAMRIEPIPDSLLASPHPEADADSAAARGDRRLLVAFFGWGPAVPNWGARPIDAWPKAYGLRYVLAESDLIPERTPDEAEAYKKRMGAIRDYIVRYDNRLRDALRRAGLPVPAT